VDTHTFPQRVKLSPRATIQAPKSSTVLFDQKIRRQEMPYSRKWPTLVASANALHWRFTDSRLIRCQQCLANFNPKVCASLSSAAEETSASPLPSRKAVWIRQHLCAIPRGSGCSSPRRHRHQWCIPTTAAECAPRSTGGGVRSCNRTDDQYHTETLCAHND